MAKFFPQDQIVEIANQRARVVAMDYPLVLPATVVSYTGGRVKVSIDAVPEEGSAPFPVVTAVVGMPTYAQAPLGNGVKGFLIGAATRMDTSHGSSSAPQVISRHFDLTSLIFLPLITQSKALGGGTDLVLANTSKHVALADMDNYFQQLNAYLTHLNAWASAIGASAGYPVGSFQASLSAYPPLGQSSNSPFKSGGA